MWAVVWDNGVGGCSVQEWGGGLWCTTPGGGADGGLGTLRRAGDVRMRVLVLWPGAAVLWWGCSLGWCGVYVETRFRASRASPCP
jgi:hypothetical protein